MSDGLGIVEAQSQLSEFLLLSPNGERIMILRRDRPLAVLMSAIDLGQLEQQAQLGHQLVLALGQNPQILDQIECGQLHPVMLSYGLWKDEEDLATLSDEITVNRQTQSLRPALEL